MKKIISTTSVQVELKNDACGQCRYVTDYVRRQQRRQLSDPYERFCTTYRTEHGQVQETSDRIRMVITLPKSMQGKPATFERESAEIFDFFDNK